MNQDLTRGPVMRSMLLFAIPMILGDLLQQCYNVADTLIVGRFVGTDALAAVGSSYTLMTFLTSILLGLCMGSGALFSMHFGRRDGEGLRESLVSSFVLIAVVTVVLNAASFACLDLIRVFLQVPDQVWGLMRSYLAIIFTGIPAIFLYNYFASFLRAVGNSVVPLAFLAVSALLNIVLDLWFVLGLGRSVAGAAEATVISQYVSGIGILLYTLVMVQGLVNSFGPTIMAAFAAAVKIDSFAYLPVQDFGNAFSTFIAQNYGAKQSGRIRAGLKGAVAASMGFGVVLSALVWVFAAPLMGLFVEAGEAAVIAEGVLYLHIEGAFYCGIGCLFLLYGLYRALGKPGMSVVLTVISLGTRVALAYLLSATPLGVTGIWWSVPIGWALADAAGLGYYLARRKKLLAWEN